MHASQALLLSYIPNSLPIFFFILLYMYECFACMFAYAPPPCSAQGDQKRLSKPLGQELEMVVSYPGGAGNGTLVLWRSSQAFNC